MRQRPAGGGKRTVRDSRASTKRRSVKYERKSDESESNDSESDEKNDRKIWRYMKERERADVGKAEREENTARINERIIIAKFNHARAQALLAAATEWAPPFSYEEKTSRWRK
jgi:hypothetical protein